MLLPEDSHTRKPAVHPIPPAERAEVRRLVRGYFDRLAADGATPRPRRPVSADVLVILKSDGPPSYAMGFKPDPRHAELHARVDAEYHASLAGARSGSIRPRLPLGGVAPTGWQPEKVARRSRPDDRRKATRGDLWTLRRVVRRLVGRLDRDTADALAGFAARLDALENQKGA